MNTIPKYEGRPTVYLDQNMLDIFVKHGVGDFGQRLTENYQVVYSDETLKEIRRSVGHEHNFLHILNELKSFHLKVLVEQPEFIITDQATITDRDVFEAFEEHCGNYDGYGDIENAVHQWLFKFSGGRSGDSISDIHVEQLEAFSYLTKGMLENAEELPDEVRFKVDEYSKIMTERYKDTLKELEISMKKNIPNSRNWNGIKTYRDALKVGPKELNNIEPPKVIEKIWSVYKQLIPSNEHIKDIDDFFYIKSNPIYPGKPYHKHQKVTVIYNMLNTLGYYPDSKVHKERRFIAAMSDNSHASMASFCSLLLSRDDNFVKKVQAAYEYLEIPTVVNQVTITG